MDRYHQSGNLKPRDDSKYQKVQCIKEEKDILIKSLQVELEKQQQSRIIEAKEIEEKAAKIKEWVAHKLKELEDQNNQLRHQLKVQNDKYSEQIEMMKNKILEMSLTSLSSEKTHCQSLSEGIQRDSCLNDTSESAQLVYFQNQSTNVMSSNHENDNTTSQNNFLIKTCEEEKQMSNENKTSVCNHVDDHYLYSFDLNTTSHTDSISIENSLSPRSLSPSSLSFSVAEEFSIVKNKSLEKEISKYANIQEFHDSTSSSSVEHIKEIALDFKKKSQSHIKDEIHDYSEIYTPSIEIQNINWTKPHCYHSDVELIESRPPTPPLHRFPSWEDRIYRIASHNGLILSDANSSPVSEEIATAKTKRRMSDGGYITSNIPVYSFIKGRASQIRSIPFTGNSSDSSDIEEDINEIRNNTFSPPKNLKTCVLDTISHPSSDFIHNSFNESKKESNIALEKATSYRSGTLESNRKLFINYREKSGYLSKLGGKLKTWKKHYFILCGDTLSYWKSQHDVNNKKPQNSIKLDNNVRIVRSDGASTFEISTGKRVYYLTCDTPSILEDWINVLQTVQQEYAALHLLKTEGNHSAIEGWVIKVRNGHTKRCWCAVISKMFVYFKTPNDTVPLGQIDLRDARVTEITQTSDSCEETDSENLTIEILSSHQRPTYLLFPTKQEKDLWLYHLSVVSGGGPIAGTSFEQLVQKLMDIDGDPTSDIWRHPLFVFSKDTIGLPLTTLSSENLQNEAIKLFVVESAGIDYHVVLAQNALARCLELTELQSELLCILIKQTSFSRQPLQQQPSKRRSKSSRLQSLFFFDANHRSLLQTSQFHSSSSVIIQGWQLLSLAVSLFLPRSSRVLWYLHRHLHRYSDPKCEAGRYAIYCCRALERACRNGGRDAKPSRMEVLSILLKNPYHHSLPHAMPVHFPTGSYQVFGFDGSTTVRELLATVNSEIGAHGDHCSGFALYSDDPIDKDMIHYLMPQDKICDLISKWETALRERSLGKFENTKVIKLFYKSRMYWRNYFQFENDKEKLFLCYHINQLVLEGCFPCSKELALELTALMAQIDLGDQILDKTTATINKASLLEVIHRFYPERYRRIMLQENIEILGQQIASKWLELKGKSTQDCVRAYLTCARKWPFFGYKLYDAKIKHDGTSIWLSVGDEGIVILNHFDMQPVIRYSYSQVVTFGGCQDDFMLVVATSEGTQKLLFSSNKAKIIDLTLLVADYINTSPDMGDLSFPPTPLLGSLARHESFRSAHTTQATYGTWGSHARVVGPEPDLVRLVGHLDRRRNSMESGT